MDHEDMELLVVALEEYKEKFEHAQVVVAEQQQTIVGLQKELSAAKQHESETSIVVRELEETICILDRELAHANACLAESEEHCTQLQKKSLESPSPGSASTKGNISGDKVVAQKSNKELEEKLASLAYEFNAVSSQNAKLVSTISSRDADIKHLDEEILKLRNILQDKDAQISWLQSTASNHSNNSSGRSQPSNRSLATSGRSQASSDSERSSINQDNSNFRADSDHPVPRLTAASLLASRSEDSYDEKSRSTSFDDYIHWKQATDHHFQSRVKGLLFNPDNKIEGKIDDSSPGTSTKENSTSSSHCGSTTGGSKAKCDEHLTPRRPTRKSMPPSSPPVSLDLSKISNSQKRHSVSGYGPSTPLSTASTPSPHPAGKDSKFTSVFDSDTDEVQPSPVPVRRRPQSRSLNSFQDLYRHNSKGSEGFPNPSGSETARSEADILKMQPKSAQLRNVQSSSDYEEVNNEVKLSARSRTFKSPTSLPPVSHSHGTSSQPIFSFASSRWASGGRGMFETVLENQGPEEGNTDTNDISESDIKLGVCSANVSKGRDVAIVHNVDPASGVSSRLSHDATKENSGNLLVPASKPGLLSTLVAGKSKRAIIPVGDKPVHEM